MAHCRRQRLHRGRRKQQAEGVDVRLVGRRDGALAHQRADRKQIAGIELETARCSAMPRRPVMLPCRT